MVDGEEWVGNGSAAVEGDSSESLSSGHTPHSRLHHLYCLAVDW